MSCFWLCLRWEGSGFKNPGLGAFALELLLMGGATVSQPAGSKAIHTHPPVSSERLAWKLHVGPLERLAAGPYAACWTR